MFISGEFITQAKILIPDNYSYNGRYHRYVYNDLGDPSINVMSGYFTAKVPENILITKESNNVIITWNASEGATGYNVYSSDDPYSGYILEDTISDTTWASTSNENKKYYYITSQRNIDW